MILACQNISKAFGTTEIIKNASFHIEEREKAALVGINGAGKSTLLKIIIGEMRADEGEVILSKGKTMGYLAQHQDLTGHLSIYQEVLTAKQNLIDMEERLRQMESDMKTKSGAALDELLSTYTRLSHTFELENGYAYRSEVVGVLKGLGFSESDFEKQVDSLSGGQKTRVALGKLLLTKPDIILLDEPTNHLDMDSISWLETYLLNYSGAVLIVSHDRYFLDRVVTKVVEVDNKKVTTFEGNYTAYSQKKAMLREAAYHAWVNQQQEIHHQEEVIAKLKSFNREKSIKRAESREKMLDKMDVLEKPTEVRSDMRIRLEPRITSGNDVLTVEHLSKAFPGQTLFQDLNFEIKRGERVAIPDRKQRNRKNNDLKDLKRSHPPGCRLFYTWKPCTDRLLRSGASGTPHGKDHFPGDFRRVSISDKHRNPKCAGRLPVYKRRCLPTDSYLERR